MEFYRLPFVQLNIDLRQKQLKNALTETDCRLFEINFVLHQSTNEAYSVLGVLN